jgi:hypothetical protein
VFADLNADLVKQLARIADELSKPSPSPWIEWAKTLASFIAAMALTYFSIALQGSVSDKREQRKMRRIIGLVKTRLLGITAIEACRFREAGTLGSGRCQQFPKTF